MKEIINKEQWDFGQSILFIYLNDKDELIGRCQLNIEQNSILLNTLYVYTKFRNKKYSSKILNKVIQYSNNVFKMDIDLQVIRDNFIYDKYTKLGFNKFDEDGIYDWLKLKYKK